MRFPSKLMFMIIDRLLTRAAINELIPHTTSDSLVLFSDVPSGEYI